MYTDFSNLLRSLNVQSDSSGSTVLPRWPAGRFWPPMLQKRRFSSSGSLVSDAQQVSQSIRLSFPKLGRYRWFWSAFQQSVCTCLVQLWPELNVLNRHWHVSLAWELAPPQKPTKSNLHLSLDPLSLTGRIENVLAEVVCFLCHSKSLVSYRLWTTAKNRHVCVASTLCCTL